MIQINKLVKSYNGHVVLDLDSLEIGLGESVGLVGNNGAGKTTLFSLLLDLIQPDTGEISVKGIRVNGSEEWKSSVSSFIDESFLITYLTPEEYFYFVGDLRGVNKESVNEFLQQFNEFFNDEVLGKKKFLRDFSKGNQKKVGIVAALIGDPELIILDEPFANLDPSSQFKLKAIIRNLAESKEKTLLVSSHDLMHTVDISDRIIALEKGKLIKDIRTSADTLQELESYFSR